MSNAPYGQWESAVTPKMMALGLRLSRPYWDTDGQTLVWLEGRSSQNVLVAQRGDDAPNDLTTDLSPRGGLGYGGGDFCVGHGQVVFVADGRLYRQALSGGPAVAITPQFGALAAPTIAPNGQWVAFLHSYEDKDVVAVVDLAGAQWPQILFSGHDFYMQPVWRPDSGQLAVVAWNFPNMPWDGTELHLLDVTTAPNGLPHVTASRKIAGDADTAIFQPEYSPDGSRLAYISDATGWSHLYVYDWASGDHGQLTHGDHEYAVPAWVQGLSTYGWLPEGRGLLAVRSQMGVDELVQVNLDGSLAVLDASNYTALAYVAVGPDGRLAVMASGNRVPLRLVVRSAEGAWRVVRRALAETLPAETFSTAEPVTWQADDGSDVYGLYYPPAGPARAGELPPVIISSHGGPTSNRSMSFNLGAQYWTTRGWAYLEVNYRGSTGYGRAYMLKGRGTWGWYDVEDAVSGAKHLAATGRADPQRMVVMGGSAGGTTVMMALVTNPGVFRAGVNLFGVSNMFGLAADTHKFESRYCDMVIGKLPEEAQVYRDRSAIFRADQIRDPMIVFQGEDDKVVPKDQSDAIVESLRRRGITHEYHVYAGEGHGWRKAETIEHYYTTLERFLRTQVLFG